MFIMCGIIYGYVRGYPNAYLLKSFLFGPCEAFNAITPVLILDRGTERQTDTDRYKETDRQRQRTERDRNRDRKKKKKREDE